MFVVPDHALKPPRHGSTEFEMVRHSSHRACLGQSTSRRAVIPFFFKLRVAGAKKERILQKVRGRSHKAVEPLRTKRKLCERIINHCWTVQRSVSPDSLQQGRHHDISPCKFELSDRQWNIRVRKFDELITIGEDYPLVSMMRQNRIKTSLLFVAIEWPFVHILDRNRVTLRKFEQPGILRSRAVNNYMKAMDSQSQVPSKPRLDEVAICVYVTKEFQVQE